MVEKAEILLVDDHALILEGICHILKRLPEVVVEMCIRDRCLIVVLLLLSGMV